MKRTRLFAILLSITLVLSAAGSVVYGFRDKLFNVDGDGITEPAMTEPPAILEISATQLSSSLREKYNEVEHVVYKAPLYDLPVGHEFWYEISFDPYEEFDKLEQIVNVYIDVGLTISAEPILEYDSEAGAIIVKPPRLPVYDWGRDDETDDMQDGGDWGYAQKYFAVRYYDADGEALIKPEVTVFTVLRELETPQVEFFRQDGYMGLRWEPIEGAREYVVLRVGNVSYSGGSTADKMGRTMASEYVYRDWSRFKDKTYEWLVMLNMTFEFGWFGNQIVVIAVGEKGVSTASDPIYNKDILPILPTSLVYDVDDPSTISSASHVDELGMFRTVKMCDGSLVQMPVTYYIDQVKIVDLQDYSASVDEETICMAIPFSVKDMSALRSLSFVQLFDYPGFQDDLQSLKEREGKVASKVGKLKPRIEMDGDSEAETPPSNLKIGEYKVFATNALSEYLAINLLCGVTQISLVDFPERFDVDYLVNAYYEALYQNPLILGVSDVSMIGDSLLYVEYEDSVQERESKQREIQTEVKRVAAAIVKPGMSDLEKELAINNYLCENTQYDMDALDNAEKFDFKQVDPEYNDSFTAYGILIKKIGVCASYAAAFKLLADEVGLESIVATGYLYGDLPHAWNRVLIKEEWMTLDVTNNGIEDLRNPIFNLPDRVSSTILVEDNVFVLESKKDDYTGENEELEYYHLKGWYYTRNQIVTMLVAGLQQYGAITLRTDYELTDEQHYEIVQTVLRQGDWQYANASMWIGTIHMELSE